MKESSPHSRPDGAPGAQPTTPARLFRALQSGDEARLQELLPPLRERLARLAKQRLGEGEAEEVVQETLGTLWEKRTAVTSADHVLPFVFEVLRNKIGNAYMRARRSREREFPEEPGRLAANPASTDPELLAAGAEMDRILGAAVRKCATENETWGRVLRLLRRGSTPAEIRDAFGATAMATVHTRVFRARKRLKEILREEFGVQV